jgi:hypothetical protein
MKRILEQYLTEILVSIVILVFLVGVGYLIKSDIANDELRYKSCIEAGKQYVLGSCIN